MKEIETVMCKGWIGREKEIAIETERGTETEREREIGLENKKVNFPLPKVLYHVDSSIHGKDANLVINVHLVILLKILQQKIEITAQVKVLDPGPQILQIPVVPLGGTDSMVLVLVPEVLVPVAQGRPLGGKGMTDQTVEAGDNVSVAFFCDKF